ncbi:MAG: DUF1778 domain-containing protein [Micropepsaceae bacterium]
MPQAIRKRESARKDSTIQIRASAQTKAKLNRAAALFGQKLSEFVLESSTRRADEALLDQKVFTLSPKDHEKFLAMLDAPTPPTKELRALFKRKTAWEQ